MNKKVEIERQGNGRRMCDMHVSMIKETVSWKVFAFIMMASIAIVGGGFGWFGNDLLKTKENQTLIIKFTAEQTDRNTVALAAMQREIMQNVADNQRETRLQIERIASQLENVSKIQQVVLNELVYLKRYDELDRQYKDRLQQGNQNKR